MNKTPYVDATCIGCNICPNIAPHTFAMYETDEGLKSKVTNPQGDEEKLIQEAIDLCPVMAIHWQEIENNINSTTV